MVAGAAMSICRGMCDEWRWRSFMAAEPTEKKDGAEAPPGRISGDEPVFVSASRIAALAMFGKIETLDLGLLVNSQPDKGAGHHQDDGAGHGRPDNREGH